VDVVHLVEAGSTAAAQTAGEVAVGEAVDLLQARGLVARGHVLPAARHGVVGGLAEQAQASGAELIAMGSRGLGHLGGLLGRSVSHGLLASLDLPVLIVPADAQLPRSGFRRVLVALQDESEVELAAAVLRFVRPAPEVLAVHVPRRAAVHVGPSSGETFVEIRETSDLVLRHARRRLPASGMRVSTRLLERDGGVARRIAQAAREWDADLLVLGSRRVSDWEALLVGSTSHEVVHLSTRPVLIAPRTTSGQAR
jgi:nucleotide-binding universal stress UspA family protein